MDFGRTDDESEGGLQIKYYNGDTCQFDSTKKSALIINLYCEDDDSGPTTDPEL
jgi:hypothetical protein